MSAHDWLKRLSEHEDAYFDTQKLGSSIWQGRDHGGLCLDTGSWRGIVVGTVPEATEDVDNSQ